MGIYLSHKTRKECCTAALSDLGQRLQIAFVEMLASLVKKIPSLVASIVLLLIFFIFALVAKRAVRIALQRARVHSNVVTLVSRLVYYVLLAIGSIQALHQLGVNLAALATGLGIAGFALGFALKDILSNFLSGILILWTRYFVVGDQIRIQDFEGTVEAIELRGTILRTYDGRKVTIPNSTVYTSAVVNNTAHKIRRSSIFVTLGYGVDLAKGEELIRKALKGVAEVLDYPPPDVLAGELGDYSVRLEVRLWTQAQQQAMLDVNSAAVKAIKYELESNEISVATPMQIVVTESGTKMD